MTCIVCQSEASDVKTLEFGCNCRECVFHDACWTEYIKHYQVCPICRKPRIAVHVVGKESYFFVILITTWAIVTVSFLINGRLSSGSDTWVDIAMILAIMNQLCNIVLITQVCFHTRTQWRAWENWIFISQRIVAYIICATCEVRTSNEQMMIGFLMITIEFMLMCLACGCVCCSQL